MATRYKLKRDLINELKKVCDNVETQFDHPQNRAEAQLEFPYITVVWKEWQPEEGQLYGIQTCDIIGIVQGETNDLLELSSDFEGKVIGQLYKNDLVKNNIENINNSNLFEPFGLSAGVFPPFAGFRIELSIGNVRIS